MFDGKAGVSGFRRGWVYWSSSEHYKAPDDIILVVIDDWYNAGEKAIRNYAVRPVLAF